MKSSLTSESVVHSQTEPRSRVGVLANLNWRVILIGLGLLAIFVLLWTAIQTASPNLSGNDDYFHIKFARVMREQGLRPDFIWLPLTILNAQDYFDHHFLYHVFLIPFTFGDLRVGAKLSVIIFPALTFLMGWIVLRGLRVPYAPLWALGFFAVSEAFLYRLSMVRVQAVSLFMLLLMLHITLKGRYRWLLPLALIYTWLYDAFPLLLAMLCIYVAVRWLFDRQLTLAPLLYGVAGIGLGLIINPYFPNNIIFIYHHFLPKILDISGSDVKVGNEWYPYNTWTLVENSAGAMIAFVIGALALGISNRRMNSNTAVLFFIALLFGGLLLKSRRFIEYYPAFVLLFCAAAWKPLFDNWRQARVSMRWILPAVLLAVMIPASWFNLQITRENLIDTKSYQRFAGASVWLQANSPPGSLVFQTDWDDFTQLYYHNTYNTYTLGLDPTYMEQHDADLYQLWRDTTKGFGNIGPVIRDVFGARYVISDLDHDGFLDKAEYEPYLKEVYRDEYAVVFTVEDEPDPEKSSWYDGE